MMKRFIYLILAFAVCFSFAACGSITGKTEEKTTTAETEKHDPTIKNNRKEVLALLENVYADEFEMGKCVFCSGEAAKNMIVCSDCGSSQKCVECSGTLKNSEYLLCKSCYADYTNDTASITSGKDTEPEPAPEPEPTPEPVYHSEEYYENKELVEEIFYEWMLLEYDMEYTSDYGCAYCEGDLEGENMVCLDCLAKGTCLDCGIALGEDDFAVCFDCFFGYYKDVNPEGTASLEKLWENEEKVAEIIKTAMELSDELDPEYCAWCETNRASDYSYFCEDCDSTVVCLECGADLAYEDYIFCEECLVTYYESICG